MAVYLSRLGRFAARRAGFVIVGWVLILGLAGAAYAAFAGTLTDGVSIPGTETDRVTSELSHTFPESMGGSGQVVFSSEGDAFTTNQQTQISDLLTRVGAIKGVAGVVNPFQVAAQQTAQAKQLEGVPTGQSEAADAARTVVKEAASLRPVSADGTAAVATVSFDAGTYDIPAKVKEAVADALNSAAVTGVKIGYSSTIAMSTQSILGAGEITGLIIAALVLLIMLRGLLPAMTPLLISVVGVGVAVSLTLAFSGAVDMSSSTPILGIMLGLAVGIDYALFILNRHRRQVRVGMPVGDSIALATGTSGTAVVFAGSTVVIALLALNVVGIPFLGVMGTVGAVAVAVAVLVAVTFTPALLRLIGLRVLGWGARRPSAQAPTTRPTRTMSRGRAVATVVVSVIALAVIAIPALSMQLGLPDGSSEPPESTQYRAQQIIGDKFGVGQNGPLLIVATLPDPVTDQTAPIAQASIVTELAAYRDVNAVAPIAVSNDRQTLLFQLVPNEGPNSHSTARLVQDLRAASPLTGDVTIGVAGQASGNIDISQKLADALPLYLVVVVGLSLLIMIVVFRSLLVPLVATLGYILSLGAALGATTAIFQWGWLSDLFAVHNPGPVLSFGPILLTGVLFGLAMDYQLFLVSGMREARHRGIPARDAVKEGLQAGRSVVTAAAIIMVAVFGGFVFSDLALIRPIGFGLAIGVLFDAFIVRMTLTPAILHLVGDAAWWLPRWLNRIVPRVDIEGENLAALRTSNTVPARTAGEH